jgi:hypothetical protein
LRLEIRASSLGLVKKLVEMINAIVEVA